MTRAYGPALVLLLAALFGVERLGAGARAAALVENESRARALMAGLLDGSLAAVARSRPHPGLRAEFLSRFPLLTARPELGGEQVSYADDGDYLYGLAAVAHAGEAGARHGFVLRAWPLRFGRSGDVEFQATDDGVLWEGMNCTGRSGTEFGFPPAFPETDMENPEAGWTRLTGAAAGHR